MLIQPARYGLPGYTYGPFPGFEPEGWFTSDDGYCVCPHHSEPGVPLHRGECDAIKASRGQRTSCEIVRIEGGCYSGEDLLEIL